MKVEIRIIVSTVLIAAALTMAIVTAADFRRANEARAAGYVLRESEGSVAVYAGGNLKTPVRVTDIEVASLRETDRALIADGYHIATREELLQILEDLGT